MLSEKTKEMYKQNIEKHGVQLVALTESCQCEECKAEIAAGKKKPGVVASAGDACVYTIGRTEKGSPEILIFCGPSPNDITPFSMEVTNGLMQTAGDLLNDMAAPQGNITVQTGQHWKDGSGRIYFVTALEPKGECPIKNTTPHIAEYYGHKDYEMLVLIPIGWEKRDTVH